MWVSSAPSNNKRWLAGLLVQAYVMLIMVFNILSSRSNQPVFVRLMCLMHAFPSVVSVCVERENGAGGGGGVNCMHMGI